jgi:hypothetical protein
MDATSGDALICGTSMCNLQSSNREIGTREI